MVMCLCQKVWVLACFCCWDVAAFCDCVYVLFGSSWWSCCGVCVQLVVLWYCVLHQAFWWLADFWFHDSPNGLLTAVCVLEYRVQFCLPLPSLCPWFVSTQRKPEEESPVQDTDAKQAKQETTVNGSSDSSANNGNGVQEGKSQQEASDGLLPLYCCIAGWRRHGEDGACSSRCFDCLWSSGLVSFINLGLFFSVAASG